MIFTNHCQHHSGKIKCASEFPLRSRLVWFVLYYYYFDHPVVFSTHIVFLNEIILDRFTTE